MTAELRTVLAATTLQLASDPVVAAAATVARRTGAALRLFHAYTLPIAYFAVPSGLTTIDPEILELEEEHARTMLEEQLRRLEVAETEVAGALIEAGAAHRLLADAAQSAGADLVVVGARESGTSGLGATADRLIRKASVPVLVVRGTPRLPPRRVLAPVDLSDLSADCLRRGLAIVDTIAGDTRPHVEALFVLSEQERDGSSQFQPEQIERLAHDELERLLARVRPQDHREIDREVRVGTPREEILADLADTPEDLVVIGTHGRSGFERFLLGNVAADVAAGSPCSVLVVPPPTAHPG